LRCKSESEEMVGTLVGVSEHEDIGSDFFEILACNVEQSVYPTLMVKRVEAGDQYLDSITPLMTQC